MKKVLLLTVVAIVSSCVIFYLVTSSEYESLNSRYVDLLPGEDKLITLVNVGNEDREFIAERLDEVFECQPKLIGIDLFFENFSPEKKADTLLLRSIQQSKPVLATRHQGVGTHGVNKLFLEAALDYGYAELTEEHGFVANFDVYRERHLRRDYHFAFVVANSIDSAASDRFLSRLDGPISDVVLSRLSDQFELIDIDEVIDCAKIADRVVLFGYLGPTNEDKKRTYGKYHDDDEEGLDMYGVIVVANQILMILKEEI